MTGKERLDWLCRLRSFLTQCGMPKEWRTNFNQALSEVIKALEQELKTGQWISLDDFRGKYNEYGYKCSECGEHCDYKENYCPNCGAKMITEQDFMKMREATVEELECINDYIRGISKDTGFNFFNHSEVEHEGD